MKIYIAGKITGNPNFKEEFNAIDIKLKSKGHVTTNPAILPDGFNQKDYMAMCLSMLNCCDAIVMLDNWRDSEGATIEKLYAEKVGIVVYNQKGMMMIDDKLVLHSMMLDMI